MTAWAIETRWVLEDYFGIFEFVQWRTAWVCEAWKSIMSLALALAGFKPLASVCGIRFFWFPCVWFGSGFG
jgi:hypothetical protein